MSSRSGEGHIKGTQWNTHDSPIQALARIRFETIFQICLISESIVSLRLTMEDPETPAFASSLEKSPPNHTLCLSYSNLNPSDPVPNDSNSIMTSTIPQSPNPPEDTDANIEKKASQLSYCILPNSPQRQPVEWADNGRLEQPLQNVIMELKQLASIMDIYPLAQDGNSSLCSLIDETKKLTNFHHPSYYRVGFVGDSGKGTVDLKTQLFSSLTFHH